MYVYKYISRNTVGVAAFIRPAAGLLHSAPILVDWMGWPCLTPRMT